MKDFIKEFLPLVLLLVALFLIVAKMIKIVFG